MIKLRPPTHKIDGAAVFIAPSDPAWDMATINAEIAALWDAALVEVQDAAVKAEVAKRGAPTPEEVEQITATVRAGVHLTDEQRAEASARHPFVRYLGGRTRFQPDAPDWRPDGSPCTVRGYLTGPATEFSLCRVKSEPYRAAEEIPVTSARLREFCQLGLRGIRSEGYTWRADDHQTRAPDDVLEVLHAANVALIREIGTAVLLLARGLNVDESFR